MIRLALRLKWLQAAALLAVALVVLRAWPHAPLRQRFPISTGV